MNLIDFWIYEQFGLEGMILITLGGIGAAVAGASIWAITRRLKRGR